MSVFGPGTPTGAVNPVTPTAAQSLAGMSQAQRVNAAGKQGTKDERRKREADSVEVDVEAAQAADAVRNLKPNGDEETEEDRQEQDHYSPQKETPERPRLDVQG
jgi:hypothetical protein